MNNKYENQSEEKTEPKLMEDLSNENVKIQPNPLLVEAQQQTPQAPQRKQIKINSEELKKVKLFVGTPMYGGVSHGLNTKAALDLQTLCMRYGVEIKFSFLFNESLITRARNYIVDEFLRSGFSHLLFIDSDIHYDPQDIFALIALDKEVIGGPYPKKSINWGAIWKASSRLARDPNFDESKFNPGELEGVAGEYVFNPVPGTNQFNVYEPLEVMEIGTGFMMVKRQVFDKFKEEYPHLNYKPDHRGQANFDGSRYIHAYFDTVIDPDSHRYLSEDYMFCQYWRAIGGSIWLCPWMRTEHVGTYGFKGDMPRIAQLTGSL